LPDKDSMPSFKQLGDAELAALAPSDRCHPADKAAA
jgi:hypothetical protein